MHESNKSYGFASVISTQQQTCLLLCIHCLWRLRAIIRLQVEQYGSWLFQLQPVFTNSHQDPEYIFTFLLFLFNLMANSGSTRFQIYSFNFIWLFNVSLNLPIPFYQDLIQSSLNVGVQYNQLRILTLASPPFTTRTSSTTMLCLATITAKTVTLHMFV